MISGLKYIENVKIYQYRRKNFSFLLILFILPTIR